MSAIKQALHSAMYVGSMSLLCIPSHAYAQQNTKLEDVVVSANRVAVSANKVGSSVTVITAKDLEKKQAATLEDVLKDVPGLYVYGNGNSRNNTNIKLRGYDSGRLLILIDGVKIDNQASQMYDRPFNHLQAADIERVEVLRGSQSALYGSDAVGGVISITTKSGKNSDKILEGVASAEIGSNVDRRASLTAWGRYGDVYYKASGSGNASHGHDIRPMVSPNESDGSKSVNYNIKIGADAVKDWGVLDLLNVEGSYNQVRGDAEYDTSTSSSDSDGYQKQRTETALIKLNAKMFDGLLDNTLTASRMDAEVTVRSNRHSTSAPSRYWGDLQRYEYQGVLQPLDGHVFVFGADQERDHYRSHVRSTRETASLVNSSVFGDYSIDLLDKKLTLGAGVRGYFHDSFGDHTTYRASASYNISETGTRIHGSYATGFKAPTLKQTMYNRDIAVGDGHSATIDPEESRGYDFGVEQTVLDDRLVMDVTVFNTRLKNAIETDGSHGSGNTYYVNIGSVRNMGVETSLDFDVTDEWQVGATYTYTQSRDNGTGLQMEEMPVHQGSVRVSYAPHEVSGLDTWVRMNAAGRSFDTVRGQGRVALSGYATFDLGANYEIDKTFSVYGRVENLFDEEYCQKAGFENAGIAAYAGVRAKF